MVAAIERLLTPSCRRRILPWALIAGLSLWLGAGVVAADEDDDGSCSDPAFAETYACRQVIVHYTPEFEPKRVMVKHGLGLIGLIRPLQQAWFEAPPFTDIPHLIELLEQEPGVGPRGVERNEDFDSPECNQLNVDILELGPERGAEVGTQTVVDTMRIARDEPLAGEGVVVAVLDTGISRAHPDLAASLVPEGIDTVGGSELADDRPNGVDENNLNGPDEGWGHGTAVAGLINLVAPGARLLAVRVLNDECEGSAFSLAAGIVQAVDAGADILNISLGAREESDLVEAALDYAKDHDVLVVASAGNASSGGGEESGIAFPAEERSSLAVAAVDALLIAPSWIVADDDIELVAPGVAVLTPYRDAYAEVNGTSFSSALVSGAAAVALWAHPHLDRRTLTSHLRATAIPVDAFNDEELHGKLGAGVPNIEAIIKTPVAPIAPDSRSVGGRFGVGESRASRRR